MSLILVFYEGAQIIQKGRLPEVSDVLSLVMTAGTLSLAVYLVYCSNKSRLMVRTCFTLTLLKQVLLLYGFAGQTDKESILFH